MVWDSDNESTASSRPRSDALPCRLREQYFAIPYNYEPQVSPIGLAQRDTVIRLLDIRVNNQLSQQQGAEGHQVCTVRSTLNNQVVKELGVLQPSRLRGQPMFMLLPLRAKWEKLGDRSGGNPKNLTIIDRDNRELVIRSTSFRTSTRGSSRRTNQRPLKTNPPMMGNPVNPTLVQTVLQAINNQGNLGLGENLAAQYNLRLPHVSQSSPQPKVGPSQPIYNAPSPNHPYHPLLPPIYSTQPVGAPPIQQPLVAPSYPPPHQSTPTYHVLISLS
ncbi:hypothetical protein AMTR_s00003p00271770 [Amborella trichopoda]|uniref:Uncharacterized protein n=1 Tax=Amborella trichopoda TaxID=13333 RepID=W1P131_AMBTC|nr:hypothetical protein AMTR_s00003p00271770 [Amborella trichopoda]